MGTGGGGEAAAGAAVEKRDLGGKENAAMWRGEKGADEMARGRRVRDRRGRGRGVQAGNRRARHRIGGLWSIGSRGLVKWEDIRCT